MLLSPQGQLGFSTCTPSRGPYMASYVLNSLPSGVVTDALGLLDQVDSVPAGGTGVAVEDPLLFVKPRASVAVGMERALNCLPVAMSPPPVLESVRLEDRQDRRIGHFSGASLRMDSRTLSSRSWRPVRTAAACEPR